jgi:hypothetical protein
MQCVGGAALMLLSTHIKRTLHSAQNSKTRAFHGQFRVGVLYFESAEHSGVFFQHGKMLKLSMDSDYHTPSHS